MAQSKLILRNTRINTVDLRKQKESMPFVRVHMSADLTPPICEAMGWTMPGPGIDSGKLAGSLVCTHLLMIPSEKALGDTQFDIAETDDFSFTGEVLQEGKRVRPAQLHFVVRSNSPTAAAEWETYWRRLGDTGVQARISYTPQPKQEPLFPQQAEQKPDDQPALAGAAVEQPDEAEDATHETAPDNGTGDDWSDADKPGSPALASKMEVTRREQEASRAQRARRTPAGVQ